MKKKIRIEITTLTEQSFIIRKTGWRLFHWCSACGAEVVMVTPDEAAAIALVNTRTIYRWVESGQLHFTETPEGGLLVCLESLPLSAEDAPESRG